ncbi:MAG: diguanylate cyclase [Deltaproteobacteria bacterium]|nr:diguanylate cyclase [Deltaproteobacteria bacterium]
MAIPAELPPDEPRRLAELVALELLDSVPEPDFDRLTRMAAADLGCPIALVSLVDAQRQWFKSRLGLVASETPRDQSLCAHAILEPRPLVVRDALLDPRFADNALVVGPPHLRFYAGVPLRSRGHAIGTLCVIDTRPRDPTGAQLERLVDLARLVERDIELRRATRELARAQATYRELTDALPMPLVVHRDRRLLYANRAAADAVGVAREALVGRRTDEFLDPLDVPEADARARHVMTARQGVPERDFRLRASTGRELIMSAMGVPVRHDGEPAVATLMRDVTRLRELEADARTASDRLARERALLTSTLSSIRDGVTLLSAERRLLYANPAYFELLGIPPDDTASLTRERLADHLAARSDTPDEVRARFLAITAPDAPTSEAWTLEFSRPRRLVLERREADVPMGGFVVVWRDVTALEAERTRLAHTDPLTQLLNRRGFEALLPRERARARRGGIVQSVIAVDVDHFKALNDGLGHLAGDRVLVAVARVIASTCRASDLVARWGGEEFLVWIDGAADGAWRLAERIRQAVDRARPDEHAVTVSCGIATLLDPDEPLEAALGRADQRLYEAKRAGRNRVEG